MKRPLRLLVIGGVAAGPKAAAKARRDDPSMDITIITDEQYISYGGCGLAYYIGGIVTERSQLLARSPETFRDKQNITVLLNHRAERINTFDRTVRVTDRTNGTVSSMPYDRLLIATGSNAVIPSIPGIDAGGVFSIKTIPDAEAVRAYLDTGRVQRACIIGGGYIGMEAAENLTARGISCTLFEGADHLLPRLFDPDLAALVHTELQTHGTTVHTGAAVERIETDGAGTAATVIADGVRYPCELVIVATGVTPSVTLARESRIALGPTGAIRVDKRMETSIRNIFAAGDCVESINLVTGTPGWYPLGSTANKQGRVAGANIAGGNKQFDGVTGTALTKIFTLAAGRTGLSDREALEAGISPLSVKVTAPVNAAYYPGDTKVTVKLTADTRTKRLVGAQAIGTGGVDRTIDAVAAALTGGVTITQMSNLDISYSPPYSTPLGALIVAAGILEEKLGG